MLIGTKSCFSVDKSMRLPHRLTSLYEYSPVSLYMVVKNPDEKQWIPLAASWTKLCRKKLIGESCSHVLALSDAKSLSVIDSRPRVTRIREPMGCSVRVRQIWEWDQRLSHALLAQAV